MTIALFGATGQTGKEFLDVALKAGHTVKALARTPSKLEKHQSNGALTILQGDILDYDDAESTVSDTDIVVSLFGHVKGSPDWLQTEGTKHIVQAMKVHDVDRILSLSGGGLPYPEKDQPGIPDKLIRFIMKIVAGQILADAKQHAEVLKQSGLNWTIMRAPRLTNGERKGEYREGWVGVNASTSISRKDLADFILKEVHEHDYPKQMPFVSY